MLSINSTIGRKLTQINLIITLLVMWLIVAHLSQSSDQKNQLQYLMAQTAVYEAATRYQYHIDAEHRKRQTIALDPHPAQDLYIEQLDELVIDSQRSFKLLHQRLEDLLDLSDLLKNEVNDLEDLRGSIDQLRSHGTRVQVYRSYAKNQLALPENGRDAASDFLIGKQLNGTQTVIQTLLDSLSYLPRTNANAIDRYQDFLINYWSLFNEVSELDNKLLPIIHNASSRNQINIYNLEEQSERVNLSWEQISLAASRMNDNHTVFGALGELTDLYNNIHQRLITQIFVGVSSGYPQYVTQKQWTDSVNKVRSSQYRLASIATDEMNELSATMLRKARFVYALSLFLLVACVATMLLSLYAGRKLKKQAFTDSLTGLSNRTNFENILTNFADDTDGDSVRQMVAFINIERFKQINDTYGHSVGDRLLQQVATRIAQSAGKNINVARIGSDKFAIHKAHLTTDFSPGYYLRQIVEDVRKELKIDDATFHLTLKIGYALTPEDSEPGVGLLKCADIARYRRDSFDNASSVCRYSNSIGEEYKSRQHIQHELKYAIEKNQFDLHYQPKVDARNGTVRSVEALLRWNHPVLGNVSPAVFIPVAEEMGLLGSIGDWVLKKGCKDIAHLHRDGLSGLGVAINISAQQFIDKRFIEKVSFALDRSGMDAVYLELEVTESLVMHDIKHVSTLLTALREKGITIAIDDFGTGYSCLQHLQVLPLDTLKIDRAFVRELEQLEIAGEQMVNQQSLVSSIIQLGNIFGLRTVAEGVETEEQLACLRSLGADLIQGFYFSKAVPLADLKKTIIEIEQQAVHLKAETEIVWQSPNERRDQTIGQMPLPDDNDKDNPIGKVA